MPNLADYAAICFAPAVPVRPLWLIKPSIVPVSAYSKLEVMPNTIVAARIIGAACGGPNERGIKPIHG